MNRRNFLRALALSPLAPVLLCAKEKELPILTLHAGTDREVMELMAAQRMAYPAYLIHEDGSIEPIKNEHEPQNIS